MKKFIFVLFSSVLIFLLSGCGECNHQWKEASCTDVKTCESCGATEGEALSHQWIEATCTTPKICTLCGLNEGEANGHIWADATCTVPKTCSTCNETDGEALGHDAQELTCINDAVCSRCNETVKTPGHIMTEATCVAPEKCSVCGEINGESLGHTTTNGTCDRCGIDVYETVSGSGDDVITDISVGDGIYKLHFTHSGGRNFIVKSFDAKGDNRLLINEIGNYDGYVLLLGSAPFAFEITADGSWSYTFEPIMATTDTSFSGTGDFVTDAFCLSSQVCELTHDGNANFIVKLYGTSPTSLLVNEIGAYEGKKMLNAPKNTVVFFEIVADGNWTINFS